MLPTNLCDEGEMLKPHGCGNISQTECHRIHKEVILVTDGDKAHLCSSSTLGTATSCRGHRVIHTTSYTVVVMRQASPSLMLSYKKIHPSGNERCRCWHPIGAKLSRGFHIDVRKIRQIDFITIYFFRAYNDFVHTTSL